MAKQSTVFKTNLYDIIISDLLKKIDSKEFSYTKPFCTEKSLSESYNVSRITAKRAITELEQRGILYRKRGCGSFVVSGVSASNDYTTAKAAVNPMTYSLLLPYDATKGGFIDVVDIVNNKLNSIGYSLAIYITNTNTIKERVSLSRILQQETNGLIYYPFTNEIYLDVLNELILTEKPVIIMDKTTDCPYIHNIVSDNSDGSRMLTEHLISLGHKNIAFITNVPIEKTSTVRDRFSGFLQSMRSHGLTANKNSLISMNGAIEFPTSENYTASEQLCKIVKQLYNNNITAIEAENDGIAYAILAACSQLSIRVPEEMSICGFDNIIWSQLSSTPITTIVQDFKEIGNQISRLLIQSLEEPQSEITKINVPVQMIIRASTAAPRNI